MKKRIPFGVWEPDSGAVTGLGRVTKVVNVIPAKGGYEAINGANVFDGTGGAFTTMPFSATTVVYGFSASSMGATSSVGVSLRSDADYICTSSNIYVLVKSQPNTAPVVTGSAPSTTFRDMAQYGNEVYLANGVLGSSFTSPVCVADATDSTVTFADTALGIQARSVGVLRDFVVFGGTYDAVDGVRNNRVRWSAFGNGRDITPSAATQSDYQDLNPYIGIIQRVLGGDEAYIVCRDAVVLMQYVGGATIMRFDYIHDFGTQFRRSCIRVGNYAYFYSRRGFVRVGMAKEDVQYIGKGAVDNEFARYLTTAIDADSSFEPIAYHDEQNSGIGWMCEATNGNAFFFNYSTGQWTFHGNGEREGVKCVYATRVPYVHNGYQNSILRTVSTAAWAGSDSRMYALNDETQKAKYSIATGFEELAPGKKSIVDKVWPVYDIRGAAPTNPELVVTSIPKLAGVNLYNEPTSTYSSTAAVQSDGFWTVTGPGSYEGRFHRFQLENSDTASERTGEQAILGLDVEYFERGNY